MLVAAAALAGGLFGDRVLATDSRDEAAVQHFSAALATIRDQYVDQVPPDVLIEGAIRGMLRTLDPHSNFLNAHTFKDMRIEQKGAFYGLGISIQKRGDELTVVALIEGAPAQRLGIQVGDIISEIEGVSTRKMPADSAVTKLRGPKGTTVNITIEREGLAEPLHFSVERAEIPLESVASAMMLRPGVGYLRLTKFSETTSEEVDRALSQLKAQGMEQLIFDLRLNSGGLLDQAVEVANKFLDQDQVVVSTRGRVRGSNHEYRAEKVTPYADLPLVVLVNLGSASASEIVAGAIQDHDRGLIVGETTWGKGLVQTVYSLEESTGLALTTARYFTPSGRLIQRAYSESLDAYLDPHLAQQSSSGSGETAHTDLGRSVKGGGGITPDRLVKFEDHSELVQRLRANYAFFNYAKRYVALHPEVPRDFKVDEGILADFAGFLQGKKIDAKAEELSADRETISWMLERDILGNRYGRDAEYRAQLEHDPQVAAALALFKEAKELLARSRRVEKEVAERR